MSLPTAKGNRKGGRVIRLPIHIGLATLWPGFYAWLQSSIDLAPELCYPFPGKHIDWKSKQ